MEGGLVEYSHASATDLGHTAQGPQPTAFMNGFCGQLTIIE